MRSVWLRCSVAILALATGTAALSQTPAPGEQSPASGPRERLTVFPRDYFDQFAPRSALDIARRVPGFTLDPGGAQSVTGVADVRGFAGVAGNVVINGARPSSKAETIDTLLARIPAQRVVRVELGSGDMFGSDYAGKAQVLNLILSAESGIDANVTASTRRLFTGQVSPDISGSALIKRGQSTINLSAGLGNVSQAEEGTDTVIDAVTGDQLEFREKLNTFADHAPFVAASWALERASDRALRANIRWSPTSFSLDQRNRVTYESGFQADDSLFQRYRNPVLEVGGDVTRPLAGGAIKLVGLATRRKRNDRDTYLERDGLLEEGGVVVGGDEQTVKARRNETIGRVSWTRANLGGVSFEAGAEAAYNTLDSAVEYYVLGPNDARNRVDLPIDDATVKEIRGEVYVSVGKTLSPALRIDGGVNYEMSKLKVRGDALADRSLRFLKPNLAIDWKPAPGWHARLSVRRTVAQLNFYDFVSFKELSNDRVNGGNAELLPQRTWEVRGTVDRTVLGSGLLKLDVGIDRVSLLQDQILTEEGFSAPGNLGTGKRHFARLTLDAPLDRLGLGGVTIRANGQLQRTRVKDPISGTTRNFSDYFPDWEWTVELRRDVGPWSYGISSQNRDKFSFFRALEIDSNYNIRPLTTAFVEYRPSPRTSVTFDIENLLDGRGDRRRQFFDPNRSEPEPEAIEIRRRSRHLVLGLTLKQSFGGSGGGVAKGN